MYKAERWAPLPIPMDVFLIALETTEELKNLLGATSVRVAYNRGGTILVEWTMMHRETFAGLVGEYVIRKPNGEFHVVSSDELMSTYAPFSEEVTDEADSGVGAEKLGKVLAVYQIDGVVKEALYELPDGTPATFVRKSDEEVKAEAEAHIEQVKPKKDTDDNGVPVDVVKQVADKDITHRPNPGNVPRKNKEIK